METSRGTETSGDNNASDHQYRTPLQSETNLSEINWWRVNKVDPMLDRHEKILIDGTETQPGLVLSQGLLHGKFDMLIKIGFAVIALITLFGTLISIFEVGGPWIRQKLGLPASYVQPAPVSKNKNPSHLSGGFEPQNAQQTEASEGRP